MAKNKKNQQQEEAELKALSREQLLGIAADLGFNSESASNEDIIKTILKAQEDSQSNGSPPSDTPPKSEGEMRRLQCDGLKGKMLTVSKGVTVQVGDDGIFEVNREAASRLLRIPGYKEA